MTLICFDLDGTLLDPMEGIRESLLALCQGLGIPCPDPSEIAPHIGLDLRNLIKELPGLSDPRQCEAAMATFWKHFGEEGVFAQSIHEGAHLMLARLKRQGHRLYLLTGQPATHARRALHHFDLSLIFDDVIGPLPLDGWKPKREVVAALIRDGIVGAGGFLIGDRADDIEAGRTHGLRTIGVTHGYGNRQELEAAGADVILASIPELDAWLKGELTDPEIHDPFSRSE